MHADPRIDRKDEPENIGAKLAQAGLAASVVYLLLELAFNAALINSVATGSAGDLEQIGRLLAAGGAALMALRLPCVHTRRRAGIALLCGAVAGYLLQVLILNAAVASVPEPKRADAPDILLMERALALRVVSLKGLNAEIVENQPSNMTFISLLGYFSWGKREDIAALREQRGLLRQQISIADTVKRIPEAYDRYQAAIDGARQEYRALRDRADQAQARIAETAGQYSGILDWFTQKRTDCGSDRCRAWLDNQYDKRVEDAVGRHVDWQAFCDKQPDRSSLVSRGGRLVRQTVPGGYDCSGITPAHIEATLRREFASEDKTGAVPPDFESFLASEAVQQEITDENPGLAAMLLEPDLSYGIFADRLRTQAAAQAKAAPVPEGGSVELTKAVLIPPLAITFSLFFSLLNLAGVASETIGAGLRQPKWYYYAGLALLLLVLGIAGANNGIVTGLQGLFVDAVIAYERLIYPVGAIILGVF